MSSAGDPDAALTRGIDIRRDAERFATRISWLDSRHSFSFGGHYDPDNTHFGLLLVNNHDVVAPATGFETHPHRDMEIVTWVLEGALVHQDSEGHAGLIHPGLAQRMSAGSGILHSEKNDGRALGGRAHPDPVQFVQMWVQPDVAGIAPSYEQYDMTGSIDTGELVPIASGMARHHAEAAIRIRQRHAALYVTRLAPGARIQLPRAPFVHAFVARGTVELETDRFLETGDAARITDSDGQWVEGGPGGAEVLVWEMTADLAHGAG